MRKNFQFKVKKSTSELYILRCVHADCTWRLRATKLKECTLFKIKKYCAAHMCYGGALKHDHRQAKSWVVGHLVQEKFTDVSRTYRPKDIIQDMRKEYGVNLSYDRAWRSSEEALRLIRGDLASSYGLLAAYGEALKIMNPGTIFELELEGGKYFKYVFMTLGQSIRGFLGCIRPVLVVDRAHLKGKFRGVLLSASGVDANNQIYPVAFVIVDGER
ncbi:uncharacterized protein LOC111020756 [Momordica charantia]|uniref:Uncharacterized protein LOC111020756 n=1 Tax=Momordica charantia TaxID=3673 RepID=A0A6J1DG46_MOMCH|nr:uncharacterized protein LOC111020756 [Momordica charantia]